MIGTSIGTVTVVADPKHSPNRTGRPVEDIAGKTGKVMDRNSDGDCLTLFDGFLADIDHRDVESVTMHAVNDLNMLSFILAACGRGAK